MDLKQGVLSLSYFWLSIPITSAIIPPPTEIQPPENEVHFGNVLFMPRKGWTACPFSILVQISSVNLELISYNIRKLEIHCVKASPIWNLQSRVHEGYLLGEFGMQQHESSY